MCLQSMSVFVIKARILSSALLYKGYPSADTLLFLILYILENRMKAPFTIHAAEMKFR